MLESALDVTCQLMFSPYIHRGSFLLHITGQTWRPPVAASRGRCWNSSHPDYTHLFGHCLWFCVSSQEEDFKEMLTRHYSHTQPPWYSDFGKPNCSSADPRKADLNVSQGHADS